MSDLSEMLSELFERVRVLETEPKDATSIVYDDTMTSLGTDVQTALDASTSGEDFPEESYDDGTYTVEITQFGTPGELDFFVSKNAAPSHNADIGVRLDGTTNSAIAGMSADTTGRHASIYALSDPALPSQLSLGIGGQSISLMAGTASPNGVVTALKGSLFFEKTTPKLYQNTNGGTAWSSFATGSPTNFFQTALSGTRLQIDQGSVPALNEIYLFYPGEESYLYIADFGAGSRLVQLVGKEDMEITAGDDLVLSAGGSGGDLDLSATGASISLRHASDGSINYNSHTDQNFRFGTSATGDFNIGSTGDANRRDVNVSPKRDFNLATTTGDINLSPANVTNIAKISPTNLAASIAVGVLNGKIPIYDGGGTLVGYVPIYATIT